MIKRGEINEERVIRFSSAKGSLRSKEKEQETERLDTNQNVVSRGVNLHA